MGPLRVALAAVFLLAVAGCGGTSDMDSRSLSQTTVAAPAATNVVAAATATADLSDFVTAVRVAGLDSTLSGSGPFTVLAPTNEAFAALPHDAASRLLLSCNSAALKKVILYHVVRADLTADRITASSPTTLEGKKIVIATGAGRVLVNGVGGIYSDDIVADNGVVKTIHAVLVPPDVNLARLAATC